ncbi:MAG: hypothetical protein KDI79_27035, partial [Anaerolineae bacterium]|nr:hypothetical protein [Anaerolineae bacterium]
YSFDRLSNSRQNKLDPVLMDDFSKKDGSVTWLGKYKLRKFEPHLGPPVFFTGIETSKYYASHYRLPRI